MDIYVKIIFYKDIYIYILKKYLYKLKYLEGDT